MVCLGNPAFLAAEVCPYHSCWLEEPVPLGDGTEGSGMAAIPGGDNQQAPRHSLRWTWEHVSWV